MSVRTGALPVVEKAMAVSKEEGGREERERVLWVVVFSPQGEGL